MKHLGTIAAVAGLLLQVGAAHAISFAPPRPIVPTAVEDPSGERTAGLTLGLAAASWDQPDQTIRDSAGTLLGAIEFGTQVRPVITAEYRVNDTWSLGCWYNFVSWDTVLHPVAAPSSVVAADASVDGGIYELHVTRDFPGKNRWDLSAQLGFQHTKYEGSYRVATVGQGIQTQKFEYESQQAVAWGLGTYKIPGARGKRAQLWPDGWPRPLSAPQRRGQRHTSPSPPGSLGCLHPNDQRDRIDVAGRSHG